jgi:hypothetical protein
MCHPLKQLDLKKLVLFSLGYPSIILLRIVVILCCFTEQMDVVFTSSVNYCYLSADNTDNKNLVFNSLQIFTVLQLGLPVIPIVLCFLVTVLKLRHCRRKARLFGRGRHFDRAITATLLVVALYIVFNVPVFINYCYYGYWLLRASISLKTRGRWVDYDRYYSSVLLRDYSWVITYVVCVALNSALNPCVYYRAIRLKTEMKHIVVGFCLPRLSV